MKRTLITLLFVVLFCIPAFAQGLKIYISVDMEGITGITHWEECSRTGKDYDYFRRIMTNEVNAAIEGALAAGAIEIVVRDAHGSARNILPDMLNQKARLLRNWSGGPLVMMEGIDETFDAVLFVGYHAKAGTPDALLKHTSSGNVTDMSVNGISMPEGGYNALIAGHFNVPVVFVAGDQAIGQQMKERVGEIETVAVKQGIGNAALNLNPEVSRDKIRAGVEKALINIDKYKPYKLPAPYTLVIKMKDEAVIYRGQSYPGAVRTGDWELTYQGNDIIDIMKAWSGMRK